MLSRFKCNPESLVSAIQSFRKRRVLVLGDMMLDRFIWGAVSRISPEAPVPVVEVRTESTCLGGAANVARNIWSLGGIPVPLGTIGDDAEGVRIREEFRTLGAPVSGLVVDKGRPTSIKTRIIAHHQQVCRTDREDRTPISSAIQLRVLERFIHALPSVDALVVSDYAKGLISVSMLKGMIPQARSAGRIVCVDPKMTDFGAYRPATVITPNTAETERASGIPISSTDDLVRAGRKILKDSGIEHLLVTRGEEGMALFGDGAKVVYIPTVAREVFDVTGAGDTVISTIALSLVARLSILESAVLANIAAGIVVGKLGTAAVAPEELIEAVHAI